MVTTAGCPTASALMSDSTTSATTSRLALSNVSAPVDGAARPTTMSMAETVPSTGASSSARASCGVEVGDLRLEVTHGRQRLAQGDGLLGEATGKLLLEVCSLAERGP